MRSLAESSARRGENVIMKVYLGLSQHTLNPSSKLYLKGEFMNENPARYFMLCKSVGIKLEGTREVACR